jgi:UDP-glucose 4-epimerase
MKNTVLVTGGAGFVGSHLCARLVKEGHRVISLDNYFAGSTDNHVEGAEYRNGHTKDVVTLVPEKIDLIYHLGEYSRVAPSLVEPGIVWDLNIVGTQAVLEYWRERGCKLVYVGSSTKFAEQREDKVAGKNRAPYSWAKAANTELVHNYGRWYDLSYSVVYFYNVYGPGERSGQFDGAYGTIVETFKQCHLAGTACTINGEGEQTRAFTHIHDTIDALVLVGEKGGREEYAICAQEVYSLLQLAEMFGLEVEFAPATKSTRSSGADDTTNLKELGWSQQQTLKQYIESCKK